MSLPEHLAGRSAYNAAADFVDQGIPVPPGHHAIELTYVDPSIGFGYKWLTQGGVVGTLKRTLVGGLPFQLHEYTGPGYIAEAFPSAVEPQDTRVKTAIARALAET